MKDTLLTIFGFIGFSGLVLHFVFTHVTQTMLQLNQTETDEIFASSRFKLPGTLWMRARLFLPWVHIHSISKRPTHIRCIVWAARLGGSALFLGFSGVAVTQFLFFIVRA